MTTAVPSGRIEKAYVDACLAELHALKPGNVHIHAAGHGMELRHFETSARVSAPFVTNPELGVGARVRLGVDATFAAAGCNTNLGILLLCAPLTAAAERGCEDLRKHLAHVLSSTGPQDAADVFAAIARASPAGLGQVDEGDVTAPPRITLLDAMTLASDRDRIARAYVTDFEDVFEFALPALDRLRRTGARSEDAITALHMALLAAFPDSHIARKHGQDAARRVMAMAHERQVLARPPIGKAAFATLLDFDRELKSQGYNPGTTADFVVATLFAETIISKAAALQSR